MKRVPEMVFALSLCLSTGACWVHKETGKVMQADILALQTEFDVVKKAHASEKAELSYQLNEAAKHIAELKLIVEEYRRVTGRNTADFGVEMAQVKQSLTEMRGNQEVNQHRLEIIEKKLEIIHEDLSSQKVEAQQRVRKQMAEQAAAKQKKSAKRDLPELVRPKKQSEFYKLAYSMLSSGQPKAARILLNEFLVKWPKSSYSDNALYWVAESYYAEKNYRKAALTFQRVRREFSKGDKSADSLFKLGYCFFAMKMYRESLPFLKEFVQNYPKSPLAGKARQKISQASAKLKR
jgi:tol-pal system protein YbgF